MNECSSWAGLCHGVAGSGYTQLVALRATGEQRYAERARACAAFLNSEVFLSRARRPDNPASLYEGRAGTSLFLADLTHPERAAFPFMDPFEDEWTSASLFSVSILWFIKYLHATVLIFSFEVIKCLGFSRLFLLHVRVFFVAKCLRTNTFLM